MVIYEMHFHILSFRCLCHDNCTSEKATPALFVILTVVEIELSYKEDLYEGNIYEKIVKKIYSYIFVIVWIIGYMCKP